MDVSIQVSELGPWSVARLDGDVDIATAPRVREQLLALMAERSPWVVLDLDGVGFMDSTGLGVIVGVLKRARTLGGDLRLVCTRPSVRRVFEITALDRTLPLAESPEAAVAAAELPEG
jgi:anti-sigma B factor antagonist